MKRVNQGKQKLWNYLDNFMDSDYFQDEILKLRIKLNIPTKGFPLTSDLREKLSKPISLFFYPKELEKGTFKGQKSFKFTNLQIRK